MPHPLSPQPPARSPRAGLDEDLPCPKCGYNLRGLTVPRCPECGFRFEWSDVPRLRTPPGPPVFAPPDPRMETLVRCLVAGLVALLVAYMCVGAAPLLVRLACAFTLLFLAAIGLSLLVTRTRE